MTTGMGGHQKAGRGMRVWLTPPWLIEKLGPFDLDPCYSEPRPWPTAARHYGESDCCGLGGLHLPWNGLVWCNPPYDKHAEAWLARCADHGNAITLIFARTETSAFHRQVWQRADAVFFFRNRLTFHAADGTKAKANGGAPSVLVCYGTTAVERVERAHLSGRMVHLHNAQEGVFG